MQAQPNSFAQHVAAAWRAGLSMAAYAKKHGLAASTLYHWQKKLRLTQSTSVAVDTATPPRVTASSGCLEQAKPVALDKFIAVRLTSTESKLPTQSTLAAQRPQTPPASTTPVPLACEAHHHLPTNCILILPGGIRLQMSELPPPTWLAALSHVAQGVH
jgi:transposase-like protein